MAESRGPIRSALRRYRAGIALALAWVAALPLLAAWIAVRNSLQDAIFRVFSGFPALALDVDHMRDILGHDAVGSYSLTLFVATLAVPLGVLVRMIARARLRAGHADPLDRVRRFVSEHPRWTSTATAGVAALMQGIWLHFNFLPGVYDVSRAAYCMPAVVVGLAQWKIVSGALRAWLAPTIESAVVEGAIDPDEIRFSAVAVTRESLALVGGLAALTVAVVGGIALADLRTLYNDARFFDVILGYMGVAAVSAFAFQRASRISVGVDGIRVSGTSRTRFFAYRDLDEVREAKGDILLVRRGRTLVRLQLHGPDATRRAAILDRMRAGIARVAEVERDGAANLVAAVSHETVARTMRGGTDYRMASVSRDALWALVEGAAVDASARTAAARAILETSTGEERARIRVAAGHCADPKVRVAHEEMADEEPSEAAALMQRSLPARQ
ncbi:MAG TPA: hypothetical protein VMI75_05550 [Polyangiaceae bacterium]|nr:hypothetical protein [Polyangiaceae bacterium]